MEIGLPLAYAEAYLLHHEACADFSVKRALEVLAGPDASLGMTVCFEASPDTLSEGVSDRGIRSQDLDGIFLELTFCP